MVPDGASLREAELTKKNRGVSRYAEHTYQITPNMSKIVVVLFHESTREYPKNVCLNGASGAFPAGRKQIGTFVRERNARDVT